MRTQRKSKKSDSTSKLVLEEIIGLTTKNANGLSSNMLTGDCVYLAGCVVVVYNVESGNQSHLMVNSRMPKPLNCVAVSNQDGGIVAAGESGHQPAVLVWDYSSQTLLAELRVHRFGVVCIAFSPDGKHLVSVGFPHDGYLCVWDWRNGSLVTKLKSSSSCSAISSVSFSSDAKFFITAGKKHMKFWTVGSSNVGTGLPAMDGKSANLGCHKGCSFIAVASSTWIAPITARERLADFYPLYALTDTGILCLVGSGFIMKKWVDLKVEKGFALSVSNTLIACGCNNGVVKLFASETLNFSASLQISEMKETFDTTGATRSSDIPDAMACQFATSEKLVVVYGDHSLYVWDVRDAAKVSRCSVLVSHSACIWDVKNLSCENMHDPTLACVARGCSGGVSFATCSTDGTIRLWDLALRLELNKKNDSLDVAITEHADGTSSDTEKVGAMHLVSAGTFERDIVESGVSTTQGFRSMAVSSDGNYLAAGDSQGNLHVYNLHTADYTCIQDAHDAEILSLTFSLPSKNNPCPGRYLLASGGKDRLIHLFDVKRGFELIESLDDHSAAVTSVNLTCNGYKILSCSADRSLVFRDVAITDTGCKTSRSHHQIASNGTVYDMAIDPVGDVAVTVGQDKKINTFNISTGKLIKTFKQDKDFGEPIKVSIDPSSCYLVCSYSNKSMCIYDFTNGELVTQVMGHGEVITGVIFLPDCKHIISVGGDGCIFVWKLPSLLSSRMLQRMMERAGPLLETSIEKKEVASGALLHKKVGHPFNSEQDSKKALFEHAPGFRFSISRLPNWAQTKVATKEILPAHRESMSSQDISLGGSEMCPNHISEGSCYSDARSSSRLHDALSFDTDKRWLTIHTVYNDLLDSPQERSSEHAKKTVISPILCNVEVMQTKLGDPIITNHDSLKSFSEPNEQVVNDGQCLIFNEQVGDGNTGTVCESKEINGLCDAIRCSETTDEQLQLDETELNEDEPQKSNLDDDLFIQHFSSLSNAFKAKARKSSARKSYSARFIVRRDHLDLTGCRRLFDTSNECVSDESLNQSDLLIPHVSRGDQTTQVLDESQHSDACEQDALNSKETSSSPPCTVQQSDPNNTMHNCPSITTEDINEKEQPCKLEESEIEKRVMECKEALLKLDAVSEDTLQLFLNLESMRSKENTSCGSGVEFYDWASKLLTMTREKLECIGNIAQSKSGCSSEIVEDSRFEPLVEKFAESLSRQVLELVKKSL